jgi:hypothetical protein
MRSKLKLNVRMLVIAAAVFVAAPACGGDPAVSGGAPAADTEVGEVLANLAAASGVRCVSLKFEGATRAVSRDVVVDSSQVTRLSGLPTGSVTVTSAGFASAACDGDPAWVSDPLVVVLRPGMPVSIGLVFRPNGIAMVSTQFIDDVPVNPACGPDWSLVPRDAMSHAGGVPGSGLHAVYSDGDERDEGPLYFGPHESGWVPSWYPADKLADASAPALWETISGIGSEELTGQILAPRSGVVEFSVGADDYASIDLGNGLLSSVGDNTGGAGGPATLQGGVSYDVKIKYANRWGTNSFSFYWRCQ